MKTSRDSALASPFRDWIEPSVPLPRDVTFIPRTTSIALDALLLVLFGGFFGLFAGLMLRAIYLEPASNGTDSSRSWIVMSILAAACASIVLFFLHRFVVTCLAAAAKARGDLRQGVFVGRDGILLRLAPNRCLEIPAARFVTVRRYPPNESPDPRAPRLDIETLDGTHSLMESGIEGGVEAIRSAVKIALPNHREPPPKERANRKRRRDANARDGLMKLARQFMVAMVLAVVAVFGVLRASEDSIVRSSSEFLLVATLVWLAVVIAILVPKAWRLTYRYRCPECSGPTSRIAAALPKVCHYCSSCNIEWDTGLEESDGTD